MNKWQKDIVKFHNTIGHPVAEVPTVPDETTRLLRGRLISEEVNELLMALGFDDLPKIADGIVDSLVVIIGTAVCCGIDLNPIWDAVQEANLKKAAGEKREDGKQLKPVGWVHPNISKLVEEQQSEANTNFSSNNV